MVRQHLFAYLAVVSFTLTAALPVQALEAGDPAPAFTAKTLDGKDINLAKLLGKQPIYLKFWATWCRYCVSELPHSQQAYERYGDRIAVLAVNIGINDSLQNIKDIYQKEAISIPTIFDEDSSITSLYKVIGTPNHVLIGRDGTIRYRSFLATDDLVKALRIEYQKAGEKL